MSEPVRKTETVVITGASAGIGRATAELFGKRAQTRLGKICNVSYLKRRASGSNSDPLAVYAHRNIAAKGTFDSPSLLQIVFHAAHLFGELRGPAGGRSRRFDEGPFLQALLNDFPYHHATKSLLK